MPFTPVHLGPAAFLKACLGRHFSFVVFGGAQVLMDIEPLVQMLRGAPVLHGPSHTLAGAVVIGGVAVVLGKPLGQLFLKLLRVRDPGIPWPAVVVGAFLGTFSHILLDGIMHADMMPWAPFASSNVLLGLISVADLHLLCAAGGLLGLCLLGVRRISGSRRF